MGLSGQVDPFTPIVFPLSIILELFISIQARLGTQSNTRKIYEKNALPTGVA